MTTRQKRIAHWALTIIAILPGLGGIQELLFGGPEAVAQTLHFLGYPPYLIRILGFAKSLGFVAIVTGRSPRLKEWAYAGFAFDFLGAAASHVLAGDAIHAVAPLAFFALLTGSYLTQTKTPGRTPGIIAQT